MSRYNLTEEEAIEKLKELRKKTKEGIRNLSDFEFKAMSPKNKEHWIKKGYSEEDSCAKAKEQIKYMQSKIDMNSTKYKETRSTGIRYWINKGYTKEEAIEIIKKRQATFTLKKCIEKHGEDEGYNIWKNRQDRWQHTLTSKSIDEIERINKLKAITKDNFIRKYGEIVGLEKWKDFCYKKQHTKSLSKSKMSITFFKYLLDELKIDKNECIYEFEHMGKFYDFKYKNKIIEFYGDYWHCNPLYFKSDFLHPRIKKYAKDIWEYDNYKENLLENQYELLIIWENDYFDNNDLVLNRCKEFLNG